MNFKQCKHGSKTNKSHIMCNVAYSVLGAKDNPYFNLYFCRLKNYL